MNSEYLNQAIQNSVLCWLATVNTSGVPNVSPKEIFDLADDNTLIIANIASPQSVKNIRKHPAVCVSLIDIFTQVGCKLVGHASITDHSNLHYEKYHTQLTKLTEGKYPFSEITTVKIESRSKIIAPSYLFYKEESVEEKRVRAMQHYGVKPI